MPLFLACMAFLSGCHIGETGEKPTQEDQGRTWGLEPAFFYEVPEEIPLVLVDCQGYAENSTKTAFFEVKTAPSTFSVLEKASDRVVYTGEVVQRDKGGFVGTFSELEEPGEYYIKCSGVGCSYYFTIGDDCLEATKQRIKEKLISEQVLLHQEGDTKLVCENLSYLMMGYEIYPDLYKKLWSSEASESAVDEPDTVSGEEFFKFLQTSTNWLLSMQDSISGGIYGGTEATACFIGVMAKYGYLYQQYDIHYATTCLKAAAKAWKYLESADAETDYFDQSLIGKKFFAASELYRASNDAKYHIYIKNNQEAILREQDDVFGWIGRFTYLSTRRRVDKELCAQIMSELLREAEEIASQSKQRNYLVKSEELNQLLSDMTMMGIVDYVIKNHEYSTVIENHIHYCLGRNKNSADYSLNFSSEDCTRFLFMLSAVS